MDLTSDEWERLLWLKSKGMSYSKMLEEFPGRTQDGLRSAFWRYNQKNASDWVNEEKLAFLDIEASDLDADKSYMLSWVLKERGGDVKYAVITRREILNWTMDHRLVKSLVRELKNVDVVVTYYGTGFDLPYVRTRALMHDLDFPHYGTLKHYDLYYTVRNKLKLHRNRQQVACEALGINGKDGFIDIAVWMKAEHGDPIALAEVLDHNLRDVLSLERLFERMKPHARIMRKSI